MHLSLEWAFYSTFALSKELYIGIESGYPPFSSKDADGNLYGFDIDIANTICEELQIKCIFKEMDFNELIPAMSDGKIDLIVASMAKTQQREEKIDFSIAYYRAKPVVIGKMGTFYNNKDFFINKTIAIQGGTIQETYAKNLSAHSTKVVTTSTFDDSVNLLVDGSADVVFGDTLSAFFFLTTGNNGDKFEIIGNLPDIPNSPDVSYAYIGITKNNKELQIKVNEVISKIHQNGTLGKISRKYFPFEIY
ncbi:transporter substrate-binding domain-containing protein [Arcobacter sp. FWKO B]|uniref:transporter substrate-binding domain-containing protein n=1 Tax=Arcobacter sp. FWKO B TaxID=2593672 RepID=UPI0018A5F88F|nr:transporter substrate-binding domain-containing protein [Arcobacter sp. FWKO B]QOG12283.1 transporter substrate-binding domain-containing protein [Arcobacter sp. FWKO B]